jgi:hypothetical protein
MPRGLPPNPRIGSPEAGMSKRGHGRARLERMNALFVARLECTIATGSKSASAAQATVVDPTSRMR